MDSIKNGGRSKLFTCFRPAVFYRGSGKRKRTVGPDDPLVAYIAVGGKEGKESKVVPKILTSLSDGDFAGGGGGKKEKYHRRFSRVIQAVLVEASLTKKNRKRKSRENSFRANSTLSEKSEKIMNEKASCKELSDSEDMLRINSSRSSSLFSSSTNASSSLCSSCASSINSNSRSSSGRQGIFRSNSMELKQVNKQTSTTKRSSGYYSSNIGLCLFLICLLVLILWGRIFAILCTSAWLFFAPRRLNGVDLTVSVVDSPDIDSEQYKKKVIMEGLLYRNRPYIR